MSATTPYALQNVDPNSPTAPIALRQPVGARRVVMDQAFRPQMLEFLPLLQKGDFIFDELDNNFYWLAREEPLPAMIHSFASDADNTDTGFISMDANATDLTTDRLTLLYQWFVGIKKDGFTRMQYNVGEQIFTTDKLINSTANPARAFIDPRISPFYSPTQYGMFFMRKGLTVGFSYFNNTGIAQVQKLRFVGKKFERALVAHSPDNVTRLSLQASSGFPLVYYANEEDFEIIQAIARPLFMRRISGS